MKQIESIIELEKRRTQMNIIVASIAIILWPLWIIFDYLFAKAYLINFAEIRIALSLISLLLLILIYRKKLNNSIAEFLLFLPAISFISFSINVVDKEAISFYFNGGLFVLLAGYLIFIMSLKRAVFYGVWSIISTIIFQVLIHKHSLPEIIGHGGIVYYSVIPFLVYYSVIKRKNIIKEFKQNMILSKQKNELQKVNEQLKARINERELLIKEVHHRVKNNLQIISSLLSLQKENNPNQDVKDILQITQNRINSMLIIHEKLYKNSDFENINFQEYFEDLIASLDRTINTKKHKININIENILLSLDKLIPCGLIVNELFTNTIQHAFPEPQKGEINIKGVLNKHIYTLSIEDNGVGIKKDIDEYHNPLGLRLIKGLSKQLKGEFIIEQLPKGSRFVIKFRNQ